MEHINHNPSAFTDEALAAHDAKVRADERERCINAVKVARLTKQPMFWRLDAISAIRAMGDKP